MYKRVRHILMLIILISGALPVLAQIVMPDSVCVGTTRHYWVVGTSGSTYTWKINGAIKGSTTDFIDVIWDISGLFNIEVQEHQENCSGEIQTGLIKVVDLPIAFAGNLSTICYGNAFTLSEATAQNFSKLLWTSSGDGSFDNAAILRPVYNLGPNDLLAGKVVLTITAEGLGDGLTCSPAVSTIELNIIRYQSTVSYTDVTCFGANNGIISIENSLGGSGNYEFTVNGTDWSGSTEYTDRAPGEYIVQMRDVLPPSCITTIDTILITEPDPLTATTEFKNASCLGDDGTISVFPHGGSGAYEFALNGIGWQSAGYFTELKPDTYIIHISDANVSDCSAIVDTIIISKPPPVTATVVQTNVSCFEGNDGNITISDPKNGISGDYKFSIDGVNWNSGMVFGNLIAGNYIVQMLDISAITCVETIASITITQPAKLIATAAKTNVTCFGGNDGSLIVSNSSGGSGSFEYIIEGKSWTTNGSFTGLIAGKYNLQMRDFETPACTMLIGEYEITEPLQLMASVAAKDISCYGSKDGSITITDAKNGVPAYQYSIDGTWKDNSLFSGLGPNTYLVRMRDANGCIQDLETIVIFEPKPLTAVVDSTNATCLGNDGTITISNPENSVSGFYEYSIDGIKWTSNGSFTDLVPKTYYVQIRDSLLITCEQIIDTIMITVPEPMLATAAKTNVKCFGGNDGTITVSGQSGGSTVYQYSKDGFNWVNQPVFTGLVAESYTIQMRDAKANECLITIGTYIITEPGQLSATAIPKHVSCFGGNNGAITFANQKGGSGNYEYSMNGIVWVASKIDILIAGFYTVQMRDADVHTCMVTLGQVEIKQPKQLTAMVEPSNVTCFGGSDGTITITNPINGTGPFQYSVDGGIKWQKSGIFTGLKAGVYPMMMVQDANNCIATMASVEINQPDQLVAIATQTNETVTGAIDGTITIIGVDGGSGNYDYSINGADWQVIPVFVGLKPDTYNVLIRDASTLDCKITRTVIILPAGAISAKFSSTPVTCYNGNDGTITFSEASGATSFEYSIDGGDTWQTSPNFAGLTAQNYLLTVHDALIPSNRADLGNIQLKQPAVLNAVITASSETFAGSADGVITISAPTGGSGVYEYSIDGTIWSSAMTYPNLTSKTYTVWIKDKNADCKISIQKIIHVADALAADVISANITCNVKNGGTNNGNININSASGATDYEYSNDGTTWQLLGDFPNLAAKTYTTMLRDKANPLNKVALDVIIITEPKELEALLSPTLPLCAGTTGTVTVFARGGTGTIVGTGKFVMAAGETRNFMVKDENGCTDFASYTMPTPQKIVAKAVVIQSKCFGVDGTVTISATGGTGALNGTGTFPVKGGRNYNFIVTDSNGCLSNMISGIMNVTSPKLEASVAPANLLCFGSTGSLKVTAIGGSGSYTYLWDDPAKQTTQTATGLAPGNYAVTITDKNGCPSIAVNGTVEPSAEIIAIASVTHPNCLVDTGIIEVTAPLGTTYEYSIDGITWQYSPVFTSLVPDIYSVKVKDTATQCESAVTTLTVDPVPVPPVPPIASVTQPNCVVNTGTITVTNPIGTAYQYSLNGKPYQISPVFTGVDPGNYTVSVKETATQCESAVTTLTVNPVPVPQVPPVASVTQPNCVVNTGTITVTNPIGTAYQYSLNGKPYQVSPEFTGLAPGNYTVKVKEMATSCETTGATTLIVNPIPANPIAPVASVTAQPTCVLPSGTIVVTTPLGTIYQYSINGGAYQDSPVFANLAPGNYTVKIKETATGCVSLPSAVQTVNSIPVGPLAPVASVTVQPNCIEQTGTIKVISPLGAGYEYSLDGIVYQFSPEFAGRTPGNYTIKVKETATTCVSLPSTVQVVNAVPTPPAAPIASVSVQPNCNVSTGTISVSSPLGAAYEYSLDGTIFQSSPIFAGLAPGNYSVVVKVIATKCVSNPTALKIVNPAPIVPQAPVSTGNLAVCKTILAVILNAQNAIVPQTGINIAWYNMATGGSIVTPTLSTVGNLTYYAQASNGVCISKTRTPVTLTINSLPATPKAIVSVPPTCNNMDGTVVVTSPIGTGFEYSLNNGTYQTSANFVNLKTNHYNIKVRNTTTGCVSDTVGIIVPAIPPAPVIVVTASENCLCYEGKGSISFKITNAKDGIYTIKYDGGEFSNVGIISSVAKVAASAGVYNNLNITNEATGCNSYDPLKLINVTITQPTQIVINETITEIDLKSGQKGAIDLQVSGGTGTYSFKWSTSETTKNIKNLNEGAYTVTVTDQNGCPLNKIITIPMPNFPPIAVADNFTSSCNVITGNLVANDSDPEGDPLFIEVVPIVNPLHGTVTINTDGTFEYVVNPRFDGTDSLRYAIYDSKHYQGDTATVYIYIVLDTDHDGVADVVDADADGDGILNVNEGYPNRDTDGDGIPDYLDIDSDNDGIVDNIEAQSTAGYIPPLFKDSNGNGVDDAYDPLSGGTTIIPVDTDGDGIPDYLDPDSDNDGVPDYIEGNDANSDGHPDRFLVGKDSDNDGLDDAYDTVFNDCNAIANMLGSNAPLQDFDGDGIKDWRDPDDDNDKILTRFEDLNGDGDWSNDDLDGDGHPEYLDPEINACELFIPNAFSPNGDNIHDYFQIYCIESYPNAKIYIFDQLGNKLYEKTQYGNLTVWKTPGNAWWDGKPNVGSANAINEMVPPGTYYYVLDLGNGEVKKSFVFVSY